MTKVNQRRILMKTQILRVVMHSQRSISAHKHSQIQNASVITAHGKNISQKEYWICIRIQASIIHVASSCGINNDAPEISVEHFFSQDDINSFIHLRFYLSDNRTVWSLCGRSAYNATVSFWHWNEAQTFPPYNEWFTECRTPFTPCACSPSRNHLFRRCAVTFLSKHNDLAIVFPHRNTIKHIYGDRVFCASLWDQADYASFCYWRNASPLH